MPLPPPSTLVPTSAQKGLPCHRQRGQQPVPGVQRPGSGKPPWQGCRTSEVSPKAHCTENQDLRREAAPTSPRSAISLCTSLFGAVWAFTLASATQRDFFKLSAFLSAWEETIRVVNCGSGNFQLHDSVNGGRHRWQAMEQHTPRTPELSLPSGASVCSLMPQKGAPSSHTWPAELRFRG